MSNASRGYIGDGKKVHLIAGGVAGHGGWAACGVAGDIIESALQVTCKACLRLAAKEAAEKAKVE